MHVDTIIVGHGCPCVRKQIHTKHLNPTRDFHTHGVAFLISLELWFPSVEKAKI